MSKKIILKGRDYYNKKTDAVEVHFFNGRKKATEQEKRIFLKSNFENINPDALSKDDRAYYGRIAGGKSRSQQAVRIDGKFVNNEFIDRGGYTRIAIAKGYDNARQLFEHDKPTYYAAKKIFLSKNGLSYKYHSENVIQQIDRYKGKIFINGKEYSKIKAIEKIDNTDKAIKRNYESFFNEYWVRLKKGGTEMHFNLPSVNKINKTDIEDLLEELEKSKENSLEIITSPGGKDKKGKDEKIPADKTDRYKYSYEILYKKKHKKGSLTGYNMADAIGRIKKEFPASHIIWIKRIPKNDQ